MNGMQGMLAIEFTTALLIIIGVASVLLLVLIVVAPWRRVRQEPPLDRDMETRLLLHRPNPEEVTGEMPAARVTDLADADQRETGDLSELRDLDDHSRLSNREEHPCFARGLAVDGRHCPDPNRHAR